MIAKVNGYAIGGGNVLATSREADIGQPPRSTHFAGKALPEAIVADGQRQVAVASREDLSGNDVRMAAVQARKPRSSFRLP